MSETKNVIDADLLVWRVHTPNLIQEILNNPNTWALVKPLEIFRDLLSELAEVSIKINDPELNAIMCRLTLYEQSDPKSKEYNPEAIKNLITKK